MSTLYAKINRDWNENFTGYSAIAIIASTCLGGFAIFSTMSYGYGILQYISVFMVVAACSIHNASILTVQKPKMVLNLFITSVIVSTVVMLVHFFLV
ncbi:hypothetical protein BST97_07265 [Nonlabens spongiae]|uniref:Uncharacterized protein n=1 Tax=Nonlabens spongiae TaxID=331648 RepID=A0A1W6MJM9_9FLAO|nr:hypothetical protein [Nonlabens spongiae]ARN77815.1 hypothetical protein BST97_07265 [Nonlabens spongiae]